MNSNKAIVITGASRGIGKSCLEIFSRNNYNIWACSKNENKDFTLYCKKIETEYKIKIKNLFFDFSNPDEVIDAGKHISSNEPNLYALVNCAGIIDTSFFLLTKIKKIKEIFQVNYFSQLILTQSLIRKMQKNQIGSIVNLISTSALDNEDGRLAYSASKSAFLSSTVTLSKELSPFNIRVNAVAPGLTKTDMMIQNHTSEIIEQTVSQTSLKKVADPCEVAELVYFLISAKASHITGQVIRVDGGRKI